MRIVVTGGRFFDDQDYVDSVLDCLDITFLAEGGAGHTDRETGHHSGLDRQAWWWRVRRAVDGRRYNAEWRRFGPAAGPKRNRRMLREADPDGVVYFPGGTGTADCVAVARAGGVKALSAIEVLSGARF